MPTTNRSRPVSEQWKTSSSTNNLQLESWKMSGKPRHAQLQPFSDTKRYSSTPTMMSNNSPWPTKPLPAEPTVQPVHFVIPGQMEENFHPPFYLNNTTLSHSHHSYPNYAYATTLYDMTSIPPQQHLQQQTMDAHNIEYPPMTDYYQPPYMPPQPSHMPPQPPSPVTQEPAVEKPKKNEKKIRQITVQSINAEHRVWIDVLPSETGLSLAEKIHVIATFRTRKVVSITTASGRKITLDNRPVFGSWMDMESFQDGERWTVEWRENDRGMVDKLLSKMIQVKRG
ncbi:hypothetical protein EDC96DRAFT_494885 [Choanephora cucurbitarum]|nr:hypothetical protein EDC96DRAFT_494885 [Choanephora cucurbitarum]